MKETERLRQQINMGMLPMPMTKDGCYDFVKLAEIYKKAGYYPVWLLNISQWCGK